MLFISGFTVIKVFLIKRLNIIGPYLPYFELKLTLENRTVLT